MNLLEEMWAAGVHLNIISDNAAVSSCSKGQQWRCTLCLLGEMRAAGVQAGVVTQNAAISACEEGRQWQCALSLLGEMQAVCSESVEGMAGNGAACGSARCQLPQFPHQHLREGPAS